MFKLLRLAEKKQYPQLGRKCQKIGKSGRYSFCREVVEMLKYLFPPQQSSIFGQLYREAVDSNNVKWVKKMKEVIELLKPNNEFGQALRVNKDERTDVKNLNLGQEYESFLATKQAIIKLSIKKQVNNLYLPIFESFFIKMTQALLSFKQLEKKGSWTETFKTDDFHYYITRNSILHILRQWLIFTRTTPSIFNRIITVLEGLLLSQPIFRFKKAQASLSIRSFHFHAVYLLIQWKASNIVWQFLSFIVDYLETKQKNFNVLFCCWIRLHHILLKRGSSYELSVRKDIQDGIQDMKLSKIRFETLQVFYDQINQVKAEEDQEYLDHLFIQVDSLLSRQLWTPTPQLLTAVLSILFMIQPQRVKFQTSLLTQLGKVIQKSKFAFRKKNDEEINAFLEEMEQRFRNIGGSFVNGEEMQEQIGKESKRVSLFAENRMTGTTSLKNRNSFVSYQKELSPWQRPITTSQSYFFYKIGLNIAKLIDRRLYCKEEEYPTTNLRFLASIKTLAIIVILVVMIILFL